jgi:hypothetical protein
MYKNRSITPFRSVADNQLRTQAINRRHYDNALVNRQIKKQKRDVRMGVRVILYF